MFGQMHSSAMEQLLPSKRSYKKLGTILEHITESINPFFYRYSVQVNSHFPLAVTILIETIPTPNVPQPVPMCFILWTDGSNGQIYINPACLHPTADW